MVNKIKNSSFGDEKIFPVINSLVDIFNERIENNTFNNNEFKYCVNLINEYNLILKELHKLTTMKTVKWFANLIKEQFLRRLDTAKLTDSIYSHMRNLIVGIHNNKIKKNTRNI